MSIRELNSTIQKMNSPKIFNINNDFNDIVNSNKTFTASNTKFNKKPKKIISSKMSFEKGNKKINYFKNKKRFSNKKIGRHLTEDNNIYNLQSTINYKDLKEEIDIINKNNKNRTLDIFINKNNQINLNNNFLYPIQNNLFIKIKNNFEMNPISLKNIDKYYSNKNINTHNKISFSQSLSPKQKTQIRYNNLYNKKDRKFSYSIKQDSSFIKTILDEEKEDCMNINKMHSNKKLLNKLYSYTSRRNNKNHKESNITKTILKTMKKSIESKSISLSKIHKNKKLIIQNNYYKTEFIEHANNSLNNNYIKLNNLKFSSKCLYNNSSSTENNKKNKRIINSATNFINSIKEERNTNKFIKELNKKINIFSRKRFSYNKENYDDNDEFYTSPKSKRMNNREIIMFHKTNFETNNNFKKKEYNTTHRNTWKKNSHKILHDNKSNIRDYQKSNRLKNNIIMPSNNVC